jgi:hypothetical protein
MTEMQTEGVESLGEGVTVRQVERTASRVVDGKAVVIVIDAQKLHTLNSVGTFIWEAAADDGQTLGSIADGITEEFEVDRARALEDARAFVAEMARLGALELRGS